MNHSIFTQSCRHCQRLKRDWYKELEYYGFEDIEKNDRIADHKTIDDLYYRKDFKTQYQFDAKVSYFNWATQMLETGQFKSHMDQTIWEYHSEGRSRRQIAKIVSLSDRWCLTRINQIRDYLGSVSSQFAELYG